jgi:hypothetical protein
MQLRPKLGCEEALPLDCSVRKISYHSSKLTQLMCTYPGEGDTPQPCSSRYHFSEYPAMLLGAHGDRLAVNNLFTS